MQALKEAQDQPGLKDSGEKPGQLVQRVLRATRATQDLPAMLELQAPQDLKDQVQRDQLAQKVILETKEAQDQPGLKDQQVRQVLMVQ